MMDRKKEKNRLSGFKVMFKMMKMMGSCMKIKKSDFDCYSILKGMMKDRESENVTCRSMMEGMMKNMTG